MIISHKYKICFFQIPRTGSTAIASLLIEHYNGIQKGRKHSSYEEFMRDAGSEEKNYFKFASIRNPLDSMVSKYFKIKSDHNRKFSRGTYINGEPTPKKAIEKFNFIQGNNASFEAFFMKYRNENFFKPHHEITLSKIDFNLRFDHLQDDFNHLTNMLNMPAGTIPKLNQTALRQKNFKMYYTSEIIPLAFESFAPIMEKYDFAFPEGWNR